MRALLAALRATPRRRARRRLLAAGLLALIATTAGGYVVAQQSAPEPWSPSVQRGADKLRGVWDAPTRQTAQAAFAASRALRRCRLGLGRPAPRRAA